RSLIRDGFVNEVPEGLLLSPEGVLRGKQVVRSHRQWEHYLVEEVGLRSDHVHERATEFEHVTSGDIPQKLNRVTEDVLEDPHGKEIPEDECKK
ncbi:MAG: hypothetical protein KDD62_14785, partial [Bdellovibrionales bacterium]|nr:hypothetical protein [Bdellovibrionales bacterium]